MTSVRAKRSLKVPNRFSSDNSQIETSNANGETIIDYNDNSTSTTHNLVPANRTIKLKPVLREPLKVKLPKLKRPNNQQSYVEDNALRSSASDVKIQKIKLPSLSAKNSISTSSSSSSPPSSSSKVSLQQTSNKNDSKVKNSSSSNKTTKLESLISVSKYDNDDNNCRTTIVSEKKPKSSITQTNTTPDKNSMLIDTFGSSLLQKNPSSQNKHHKKEHSLLEPRTKSFDVAQSKSDVSTSSFLNNVDKSLANASFSSDDAVDGNNSSSRMEIVVSQPDSSSNSGIRCPCGVDDDLGVMVECENCSTWQHGHCINVGAEEDAYEGYICGFCTLPQDRARDSLIQLTVGDKFQSRFKSLELLKKQSSSNPQAANSFYDTVENNTHLNIDELSQATKDLQRVLNSLKIKWKLFTNPVYDAELRIWANSYWSEDQTDNSEKDENLYYVDRYRGNLKLNIRNMLKKMDKRCQLIDYAISNIESKKSQTDAARIKSLKDSLGVIVQSVKEYKNKMKTHSCS